MHNRLSTIAVSLILALSALSLNAKSDQPNILLFLTDDESAFDRSAYGWSNIPTPAFDEVAKAGILFQNAYSSAPSCGAARAALLTGRHFWQNQNMALIQGFMPLEIPVMTTILQENGYWIGNTTKMDGPASRPPEAQDGSMLGKRYNTEKIETPEEVRPYDYAANFEVFLKDREDGQPFFFWAGVIEPHFPWGRENYKLLESEYGISIDDLFLPPALEDTPEKRKWWGGFLYEICYADTHLKRMIEHLKEIGELDNTIIIATADNGAYLPVDGKYLGKASPYEYGVHVPLAIMWPEKIQSSRVVEDFVSFADIAPTLLEAANIEVPVGMTGDSLTTIFNSTDSGMIENRDFMRTGLEWHGEFDPVSRSTRSIRKANYSYLVRYNNVDEQGELLSNAELTIPASEEFYDLTTDPWQLNNLIDDPKHKQTLEKMRQLYVDSGQSMNDPRVTGEMDLFRKMRQYVQKRKKDGYRETSRMSLGD
ncbi:MAG: putative sulfatase [Candidatus Azotimanducaceae bacterium]|jgi:uncharacterized sulfatase